MSLYAPVPRTGRLLEDYALIGDMQSAALVHRDGAVDWLCLPRFDSGAFFAALLGDDDNGSWRIAPAAPAGGDLLATRRYYEPGGLVLVSEWDEPSGSVRVLDLMPPRGEAPDLVRIIEGTRGRVAVQSLLRLRFDYGHIVPWVRRLGGRLAAVAGPDSVWLDGPVEHEGRGMSSVAELTVEAGDRLGFVLTWHPSYQRQPRPVDPFAALEDTRRFWREWADRCTYQGIHREAVTRSLVTLKALTYAPTGGIVAAPTTSLPELLGGERNWDYRYTWLRDATLTLQAFVRSGYLGEARAWREWLLRAIAGTPDDLQIMYGVAGERRLLETELPWLPGYEGSRPVRVGNAAADQLQLDVYGEVLETLHLAREEGLGISEDAWRLQLKLLDWLESHWDQPDEGLWEVRGPRRHFVHSKVMCWVAADRAVRTVESGRLPGDAGRFRALREAIFEEVCAKGYDADRNTFTQFYGSRGLDAALLMIPLTGFLPPDDPRLVGTVEAVQRELAEDGLLRRYDVDADGSVDGLDGEEGTFLVCSFWLADALHLIGRDSEAHQLFDRLLGLRNDVGLLAEQYDVHQGRLLGNFPQAFSHVGLVNSALNLSGDRHGPDARKRAGLRD